MHELTIYHYVSRIVVYISQVANSSLNSIHVCQWMVDKMMQCCYIDSIGTREVDLKQSDIDNYNNNINNNNNNNKERFKIFDQDIDNKMK